MFLLHQLPRVRELAIYGPEELWNTVLPFLSKKLPVLNDAWFKLTEGRGYIFIGDTIAKNMLPSLRRLSLVGMSGVPWKDIHLNDLLSLEIEGFDAANFYPIIDACPNLEQIRLRGYTSISPEYSTLSRRICMPSLRTLSLSLPASFCEQVIRCLDLRDDVSLTLTCSVDNHISNIPCHLFSILPENVKLKISIWLDETHHTPRSVVLFTAYSSCLREVTVVGEWDSPNRDIEEACNIAIKLSEPIIDRAVSFKFRGHFGNNSQIWRDFLTCMSKLHTMHVDCRPDPEHNDHAYLECLVDVLTSGISPNLRILYWEQCKLTGGSKGKSRLRKKLKQMIRYRTGAGCPLDGVVVEADYSAAFRYYSTSDIDNPKGSLRHKLRTSSYL